MFGFGGSKQTTIDADTQQKILSDPAVQKLVKEKGEQALSDPAVQAQILETCKEKFPEYAGVAANAAKEWASDPKVQAQAKAAAGMALAYAADAGNLMLKQIEQGPAGVRMLTFLVSCASLALAVMDLINPLSVFGHLIMYTVAVYQLFFSCTTILFEVPPEWHEKVQATTGLPVSSYQDMLITNAKFLSLVGGRGLFYIFQGSLWLAFASFAEVLDLAVGCGLVFMGLLHLLMHFGIMPQTVAEKMRDGYKSVAASSGAVAPLNP